MVFHQYEFGHVLVKATDGKMIYRMYHICRAMCVYGYASSKPITRCSPYYKTCRKMIFEFDLCSEAVGVWRIQIGWKTLFGIPYIGMV